MRPSASHHVLLAPQQRQRRGDHAGAQHAEQRDHALDRIGQLHARPRCRSARPSCAQPGREGRDRAVGLRIGQARGAPSVKLCAIVRVDQRERVGMAHAGAAEQVVERGAVGRFSLCYRPGSLARPRATKFPAGSRTAKSERDARFSPSALPTVWEGNTAARRRSPTAARGRARGWRRRNPRGVVALSMAAIMASTAFDLTPM